MSGVKQQKVDEARLEGITRGPLPASRKIWVEGALHPRVRVPMREIAQTPTRRGSNGTTEPIPNPPVVVYDTSGPYTDPEATIDVRKGLAPIRAKKLRYYEDANFKARLGEPPALLDAGYADCPELRSNDWTGIVADVMPSTAEDETAEDGTLLDDGGAQQAREPELADAVVPPPAPEKPSNPLGIDDDVDPAIDKKLMDRARMLAPVLIGHALDEAVSQKGEQLGLGL